MRIQMFDRSVFLFYHFSLSILPFDSVALDTGIMLNLFFQAAVYGVGVCAEFGGHVFRPLVGGRFFIFRVFTCFNILSTI